MNWFQKLIVSKAERIVLNQRDREDRQARKNSTIKELTMNSIHLGGQAISPFKESGARLDAQPDLNFRMYKAENGYIMQVHSTDRKTDRQVVNLHIIADGEDLGQAISHIITVESLKL